MKNDADQPLSVIRAPNGLELFHHSLSETKYLYQEIFEDRVYFRHGITLLPGETAFDIGANIGMLAVFVKENFKDVVVHAFEPSPAIFRVLKANLAKYGPSVAAYCCGVARQIGEATFTFYPRYSIMSGFHAEGVRDREVLRAGIKSQMKEQGLGSEDVQDASLDRLVRVALKEKQEHVCPLCTVSSIIEKQKVAAVGLLKIDAEGSELDILAGIQPEHWARIRQVVMELHDPTGDVSAKAKELLEARGYDCLLEQEKRLAGSGVVNCYARQKS